jgi:hypothetical protein
MIVVTVAMRSSNAHRRNAAKLCSEFVRANAMMSAPYAIKPITPPATWRISIGAKMQTSAARIRKRIKLSAIVNIFRPPRIHLTYSYYHHSMENEVKSPTRSMFIYGFVVPQIVAFLLMTVLKVLGGLDSERQNDLASTLVFSNFIIIPLMIGLLSAYFWRNEQMKFSAYIGWSVVNTVLAILLSAIYLREGVICLLIVSPLILLFVAGGALIGRLIYKRRNKNLNFSMYGLLFVVVFADVASDHEYENKVSDTIVINAPIDKVWPLVVEYEPITMKEDYWLFKVGMPSPVQSTVTGHEAGAERKCIFSNGYVFDEKMTVYKPNQELTFDIVSQPRDPEIMGHIDIIRGQFLLIDNGDNTTTVIGNSWYKLYVFPVWYFDTWAESITRNVHIRVMEHIKIQAEQGV